MSSNNELANQRTKKRNSYFLRTQSTLINGEKIIPFNSLYSKSKHKSNSLSKSKKKINTPKKMHKNYTTYTKSAKAKRYINPKNQKEKNKYMTTNNLGGIDLNRISGSSHSSNHLNYINNRNIIPFETNGFSVYGTGNAESEEREKELKNKNINYT